MKKQNLLMVFALVLGLANGQDIHAVEQNPLKGAHLAHDQEEDWSKEYSAFSDLKQSRAALKI